MKCTEILFFPLADDVAGNGYTTILPWRAFGFAAKAFVQDQVLFGN